MPVIDAYLKGYLDKLKGPLFERNIPYMYVDTERKIRSVSGTTFHFTKTS
jgi:hypothetical protein